MLRSSASTKRDSFMPFRSLRSDSPPLLPEYVSSPNCQKKKSSRGFLTRNIGPLLPRQLKKKLSNYTRLVRLTLVVFVVVSLSYWLLNTVLILFRFKIADRLTSSGWIGMGLKIRKPPLIFVQSSQSAAVVWESNKMASSSGHQLGLIYWPIGTGYPNQTASLNSRTARQLKSSTARMAEVRRARPEGDNGWRRWIHTATLQELQPGTTYGYDIVLLDGRTANQQQQQQHTDHSPAAKVKKTYSQHYRFSWYGIDPPDLNHGNRLSVTSPTSKHQMDILHIIVIGDNQFGVKVFKNIVTAFLRMKAYLPNLNSPFAPRQIAARYNHPNPSKPSLIFHLGDAVQSVRNLQQWQTDFWDPLTHNNKQASEIPIVYAKGNHDFDDTAHNLYSGGLPMVDVGEMNRTQTAKLNPNSPVEIPGILEADTQYTTLTRHDRDPQSRATYFAYSPHTRVRVIVCDSNLEPTRMIHPGSTLSEVDEHERWLLWEMARPEWKEASIRIILIHVPPFVEFWEKHMWDEALESTWGQYVRTRFAPHFHAQSPLTSRYDIPPASMVISGHSHVYQRGMLNSFVAAAYFSPGSSSDVPIDVKQAAHLQNKHEYDPVNPQTHNGVIYVITGGAGGPLDTERVEKWGFYERTVVKKYHFNHLLLDMSPSLSSNDEWYQDWTDSKKKRADYKDEKVKVYQLVGSQLVCKDTPSSPINSNPQDHLHHQVWESGHYSATDRLVWTTRSIDGRLLDRFVVEAASCR